MVEQTVAKKKKILVVDDEFKDLDKMKNLLEAEGYDVVTATNASKALDTLSGNTYSMVLIDIKMETVSGYDLLRLLREKLNHHIPMLFVTIVLKEEVDISDVDGFIQKPFTTESFIKEVNRAFDEFKPPVEAEAAVPEPTAEAQEEPTEEAV